MRSRLLLTMGWLVVSACGSSARPAPAVAPLPAHQRSEREAPVAEEPAAPVPEPAEAGEEEATEARPVADGGVPQSVERGCQSHYDCPFGEQCREQRCVPSQCHNGDPIRGGVRPRRCPQGQSCMFEDGAGLNHGNGWCVPRRPGRKH
jgi:hypothetical protein